MFYSGLFFVVSCIFFVLLNYQYVKKFISVFMIALICNQVSIAQTEKYQNPETQKLVNNISKLAQSGKTMFGVANGLTMNFENPLSKNDIVSDCKQICGKDPQLVENDFLFSRGEEFWQHEIKVSKNFAKNGGIIGYCWHLEGPKSHSFRKNELDDKNVELILSETDNEVKTWFISLIDTLLTPTFKAFDSPVLFRPFHEMNGNWFWWGSTTITPQQYVALFRFLVDKLRSNGVRNVIYTWSPDTRLATEYYPGDDYVDIVGIDAYEPGCSPYHGNEIFAIELSKLLEFAKQHKKIPALTETGLREIDGVYNYPNEIPDFWTSKVLSELVDKNGKGRGIAYVMPWYNADWRHNNKGPAYIPHKNFEKVFGDKGKQAIEDFKKFEKHKSIIFSGDLSKNIYK